MNRLIDATVKSIRRLSTELHPRILDDFDHGLLDLDRVGGAGTAAKASALMMGQATAHGSRMGV